MNENDKIASFGDYKDLLTSISETYTSGRIAAFRVVNSHSWKLIGR